MTVMTRMSDEVEMAKASPVGLCGGAQLRTPCGARRIENIRAGDLIVTREGLLPVRMVFSRTVTEADMAADPSLAPVCIRPRAIAPMMPAQELRVASAHRLLIPGWRLVDQEERALCLVPARDIAGPSDLFYVDREARATTYYSVVLDEHAVFSANGLPVESFLPTKAALGALDQTVRDAIGHIFPSLQHAPETYRAASYPTPDRVEYRTDFA